MGIMEGYPTRKPTTQQHQSQMDTLPAGAGSSSSATHAPPAAPHHGTAKKRHYSGGDRTKILLLFLLTNSVSILLSVSFSHVTGLGSTAAGDTPLDFALSVLSPSQTLAVDLHRRVEATDAIIKRLISNAGRTKRDEKPIKLTPDEELTLALGPHALPFGYTPNLDSDKLYPAVGAACHRHRDELKKYMTYNVTGDCPSDEFLAESLMLMGCEPLPRRRCRSRGPAGFPDPTPFPESLWVMPHDKSVSWAPHYKCKNYSCLVGRVRGFDLAGEEQRRWVGVGSVGDNLDYDIDAVLASKPRGTVRVGLDIGGGTGTFAARMAERGVTVVTTTTLGGGGGAGAPFGSFVASRGLVPLHLTGGGRLPFFDGTLDIVHSGRHAIGGWIVPGEVLDAMLYDIYRVLRPGGVFWLDHFVCTGKEMAEVYVPVIEEVGFRKLRWNTGRKLDKGQGTNADEWYISALLERPMM
ncbi:unnamed protein product [Urochloa humidicola]